MNWFSLVLSTVTTFFMAPFVVHRLGDGVYGVWVLIGSVVSYMGILDLGLRGGVAHFIAKQHSVGDHEGASRTVSAALWFRFGICAAAGIIALVLSLYIGRFFRVPSQVAASAQIATALLGFGFMATLVGGVFGGVLTGLQRFDLTAGITASQTILSAAGFVWTLSTGGGIVLLSVVQLAATLAGNIALILLSLRTYPELRIRLDLPDKATLCKFWSYSGFLFLLNILGQVVYYSDNVVVGACVSASAVTFYAIAGRLIEYHRYPVGAMAQTLMPVASSLDAQGKTERLRDLLIQGTRISLLIGWPIQLALFIRGGTFIGLWMGPHYVGPALGILRILLLSNCFIVGNNISANIVFGVGKHKPFALWSSVEAVANLTLSILLVHRMGPAGVAWGTTIPNLISQAIIWPIYICRVVHIGLREYIWQAWGRCAIAVAPFGLACLWTDRHWPAATLIGFFSQIAVLIVIAAAGVLICFRWEVRSQFFNPDSMLNRHLLGRVSRHKPIGASASTVGGR
jgi:O-antigen/teichoic acid export membrane protein